MNPAGLGNMLGRYTNGMPECRLGLSGKVLVES